MNLRGITKYLVLAALCALMVLAAPVLAFADPPDDVPENGIPLLVVYVDESDDAIAAAQAGDSSHAYGTIDDMNSSEDHSVRCIGDVKIVVPEGFKGEYGVSAAPEGMIAMSYIRGRGNTTWNTMDEIKKPYKIEFAEAQDLFGMGASTDWALMANAGDPTLLRNRITSWLGDEVGLPYTPQSIPVDVVMVGMKDGVEVSRRALGSYCLSETVEVEESRVDIGKLKKNVVSDDPDADPNITGGYLLTIYAEIQNEDEPASTVFTTNSGIELINDTPEFKSEDLTEGQSAQRTYIRDYVNQIDDLIMGSEAIDDATHESIANLLDLQSVADYWWIQEFCMNGDAFGTDSTKFHKPRNGKLAFGPLWDFDIAWSVSSLSEPEAIDSFNNTEMPWVDKLRETDPQFVELLKARWADPETGLDAKLAELAREGGTLDRYKEQLKASWEGNYKIWAWGDEESDYDKIIDDLRCGIEARRAWVNEHLDELGKVNCTVTFMVGDEVVETTNVKAYEHLLDTPEDPEREGFVFMGWKDEETGESASGFTVVEDVVFFADFAAEDEIEAPEKVFFESYEEWQGFYNGFFIPKMMRVLPEDVVVGKVVWSSSDESIATVTSTGEVEPHAIGDVVITATLRNGISASYTLHIYDDESIDKVDPTGITAPSELTIEVGQTDQILYTLLPDDQPLGFCFVQFESLDPTVAVLDEDEFGLVTGLKPGKATVTMTATRPLDDTFGPFTATCEVTVVDKGGSQPQAESHTITYKLGGGVFDGSSDDIVETHEVGETIRIHAAPTRAGYRFLYWEGSKYAPGDAYVVGEDHTFTAKWEKVGGGTSGDGSSAGSGSGAGNASGTDGGAGAGSADQTNVKGNLAKTGDEAPAALLMLLAIAGAALVVTGRRLTR